MKDYLGHEVLHLDVTRLKSNESTLRYEPIRYLGDLQRLDLKPGDKFVLTVDHVLSAVECERLQQQWEAAMGIEYKVVILHGGMKLGVIGGK